LGNWIPARGLFASLERHNVKSFSEDVSLQLIKRTSAENMANKEHLKLMEQGVEVWNRWRADNPQLTPDNNVMDLSETFQSEIDFVGVDLRGFDLRGIDLSGVDLAGVNLDGADLSGANLSGANLSRSDLRGSILDGANLSGANLSEATLHEASFFEANLTQANLSESDLRYALFLRANLTDAMVSDANLSGTRFTEANLNGSILLGSSFSGASFYGASLLGADLEFADVSGADFSGADLSLAKVGLTTFGNNDLSTVKGLETVQHNSPSTIGIDTLYRSDGRIPEVFLREAGIPEEFIAFVPSLVGRAIEFYSSFISFSHQDREFSQRLHSRMRSANLRVWYAPEDMKGGKKLHEEIFRAIQIHDKLLLVLSEDSMRSEWVMTEIRRARKVEEEENRRKLFPIRLVDFEAIQKWECFDADSKKDLAIEVREYYIPDFSNWKDDCAFEAEFSKLLSDLKATER
jgi:uncharacterized protein YjbI with pentapeptide repeats